MSFLDIKGLKVTASGKNIINGLDLAVDKGQVCVIMGPNGSGKSTLANVLLGNPAYAVEAGTVVFSGTNLSGKTPEERAALGLFLSFQQPREISGVDYYPFLFQAYQALLAARGQEAADVFAFKEELDTEAAKLKIGADWSRRYLNAGFSGGEKKKSEMLQLALLKPRLAIFDEVDSGLDVDALDIVGQSIRDFVTPETAAIVVTHYRRVLNYIPADKVVVMADGRIVATGGPELAEKLDREGFSSLSGSAGL